MQTDGQTDEETNGEMDRDRWRTERDRLTDS